MAFVNEHIPEADLQRIDFSKIIHPLHSSPIIIPSDWTIDRERDIALISLGGGFGKNARSPHFFILYWQGRIIHTHLSSTFIGDININDTSNDNDLEITWRLLFLGRLAGVPEEEVIKTLQEALSCYGHMGYKIKAVHFDFDGKHSVGG
jgi:hypothetical protein